MDPFENCSSLTEFWQKYDYVQEYPGYKQSEYKYFIKPYRNLEDAVGYLKSVYKQTTEAKFVAPEKLGYWEWKIRNCTNMCKILKTIHYSIPERLNEFVIAYQLKIFWNSNTFSVQYDASNYRINVETGFNFKGDYTHLNQQTNIHKRAQELLIGLLNEMHNITPRLHSEKVFSLFNEIRQQ